MSGPDGPTVSLCTGVFKRCPQPSGTRVHILWTWGPRWKSGLWIGG
uniref:Uncharacterized protein n=1 Tax=Nonomuraea gerenzanensis TaxID=93944 RepID=A0A1M4DX57_9ACTN|nr:hypothetical protein BN4615_P635 [Nonomuraea gerenzanensis]